MKVGFSYWIDIWLSFINHQNLWRVPLGLYVMKNSSPLNYLMSVGRVSGEWRVVSLLLMDGGYGVVCVSLCIYFSNVRGGGYSYTMYSGTYCWYLFRLTELGGCWWN